MFVCFSESTPDKKIKNSTINTICDYLWLNDSVVECIHNGPMLSDAINTTIESDEMILIAINQYLHPRPIYLDQYEICNPKNPYWENAQTPKGPLPELISQRDIEETAMLMFITDRLRAARKAREASIDAKHTSKKE